jgi:hypothetical protein
MVADGKMKLIAAPIATVAVQVTEKRRGISAQKYHTPKVSVGCEIKLRLKHKENMQAEFFV